MVFCNTSVQIRFAMVIYIPIPKKVTNSLNKNVSISFSKEVVQFIQERKKAVVAALSYFLLNDRKIKQMCTSLKRQVIIL